MSRENFHQKKALVETIAAGATVTAAAAAVGVTRRTAIRWLSLPSVTAMLARLQSERMSLALAVLTANCLEAAETLGELLSSTNPKVRLAAAVALLERSIKLREQMDILPRLEALEERYDLGGQKNSSPGETDDCEE